MTVFEPDVKDLEIIKIVERNADGIRFKALIDETGMHPATLRNRLLELAVDGRLRLERHCERNGLALYVHPMSVKDNVVIETPSVSTT